MSELSVLSERLTLVVPCYNEAARLDRAAFTQALAAWPWLDVLFVNDGSQDGTGAMLDAMATLHGDRVTVLTLATNQGKAEAVRQGLLAASERATMCGFWDADLAAPLAELLAMRAVFAADPQVEWVWGIRLRAMGRHIERRALRHYLGRLFATAASILLGLGSYDTQCGAKLFRVTPLLRTALSERFKSRWIFDVELLSRADGLLRHAAGRPVDTVVYEHPLAQWVHKAGSKVRATDFLRAFRELLVVRGQRAAWRRPMAVSDAARVS